MRKPEVNTAAEHPLVSSDTLAFAELPALRSFFLSTTYEGTQAERQPGLMMLQAALSGWELTLKDPTAMTQLRVSAPTFDGVLLLADALLGDGKAPWVPDLWARQRAVGKRK